MMLTGKDALILFYGIFWAINLSVIGRYRLLDTHLFFSQNMRRYAFFRFIAGFIIMDVAPIFWFWILYSWIIRGTSGAFPIMSAAFASLSLFGFHRILHAIIATERFHSKFYSKEEWGDVVNQWGRASPNTFIPHFLPGIGFLIVFLLIAYITGHV